MPAMRDSMLVGATLVTLALAGCGSTVVVQPDSGTAPDGGADASMGAVDAGGVDAAAIIDGGAVDSSTPGTCPLLGGEWMATSSLHCKIFLSLVVLTQEEGGCGLTFSSPMGPKSPPGSLDGMVTLGPDGGFSGAELLLSGDTYTGCTGTYDASGPTYTVECGMECGVVLGPLDR